MAEQKTFMERLKSNAAKLTQSDHKIANTIIRAYPKSLLYSASYISKETGLNISTISRFFAKIGYQKSKDVQKEFHDQIEFVMNSPLDRYHQSSRGKQKENDIQKNMLSIEIENISATIKNINSDDLSKFAALLENEAYAIFIVGERKQFSIAFYLYNQLNTIRSNVHLVNHSSAPDNMAKLKTDDLVIIFDFRRYPSLNRRIADLTLSQGGLLVAIVDSPGSPIYKKAQIAFVVSTRNIWAFDSYTAAISLVNIIIGKLISISDVKFEISFSRMQKTCRSLEVFEYGK